MIRYYFDVYVKNRIEKAVADTTQGIYEAKYMLNKVLEEKYGKHYILVLTDSKMLYA